VRKTLYVPIDMAVRSGQRDFLEEEIFQRLIEGGGGKKGWAL